ncbi:hypothetical protein HDU87_002235 [Geranomyces variabilis]|uniref:Uncharacterized protein n=1 Tax=Geranomyces variabilis TaxID=109894 RepID=A0AAD5TLJ1_9FUNG|nr:hypothetical protein HDU87_002235 [Geranomyces variabilis]
MPATAQSTAVSAYGPLTPTVASDKQKIKTALVKASTTIDHPVPVNLDAILPNPGVPRADVAQSAEHPEGSADGKRDLSVMQQHVEFFDRNKDGVIWPWETYVGFAALGFNFLFCFAAMLIIHGGFSYPTLDTWIPHPLFPIYMTNIHRCKHGSDTATYDTEGRYLPQRFEEIFSKYDRGHKGGLSFGDIMAMQRQIANVMDFFGFFASKFEFITLWLLVKNDQGLILKEDVRRMYDGTLFYHVEKQRIEGKQRMQVEDGPTRSQKIREFAKTKWVGPKGEYKKA